MTLLKYLALAITAALGLANWRWKFTADHPAHPGRLVLTMAGKIGFPLLVLAAAAALASTLADDYAARQGRAQLEGRLDRIQRTVDFIADRPGVRAARATDEELDRALTGLARAVLVSPLVAQPPTIRLPGGTALSFSARSQTPADFEVSYQVPDGAHVRIEQPDGTLATRLSIVTALSNEPTNVTNKLRFAHDGTKDRPIMFAVDVAVRPVGHGDLIVMSRFLISVE